MILTSCCDKPIGTRCGVQRTRGGSGFSPNGAVTSSFPCHRTDVSVWLRRALFRDVSLTHTTTPTAFAQVRPWPKTVWTTPPSVRVDGTAPDVGPTSLRRRAG